MSAQPHPRLSEEEYLKLDREADFKSEYFDGEMWAMAGASPAHALITANLARELSLALKRAPRAVYVADLRVRVASRRSYVYPDVSVVCGPANEPPDVQDAITNPTVIVEVLSPSTERNDRGLKFAQYREIESLQEYGLVSQDTPHVEIFRRQPAGEWLLTEWKGLGSTCKFSSVGCVIPLAEIYHQVKFEESRAGYGADQPPPSN